MSDEQNTIINTKLEQALHLLEEIGWSVIPVGINKIPLVKWEKYQKAKPIKEEVLGWFQKYPHVNLGVVTGRISGIVVIDIDPRHGGSNKNFKDIKTVISKTGGGGWHYYFKYEEGIDNKTGIKEGIDVRGEGGYVVVPPSSHQSGNNYEWVAAPGEVEIAPLPDFLRELIVQKKPANSTSTDTVINGVNEGQRNDSAASLAGELLNKYPVREWNAKVWPLLCGWNTNNNPPLPEDELRRVFESISKRELAKREGEKSDSPDSKEVEEYPAVPLEEALAAIETVIPGKRDLALLAIAVNVSHLVDSKTPLWLMFVGVPSSAKTEIARMLKFVPTAFFLDTLTENAFICGSKTRSGDNPTDLLPLLNGKCFVVKDFTTTLSQKEESVRKILGDLTSIYDDSFSKHSPARGTVCYHAFFSFLGCVTPQALNKHQRYMNQIGPRFLFFRVPESNRGQIDKGFKVLWSRGEGKNQFEEVQKKVSAFCYQLIQKIPDIILEKESDEVISYLDDLAVFIAKARGMVLTRNAEFLNAEGEKVSFYEPVEIQIEEPYRALLQLRVLARALAVVHDRNKVTLEELRIVKLVALSSMPADRALLISVIVSQDKPWTAKEIADSLGISHKTALRQMDELVSLKILTKAEQGEGLPHLYTVDSDFHEILYGGTQTLPRVDNILPEQSKPLILNTLLKFQGYYPTAAIAREACLLVEDTEIILHELLEDKKILKLENKDWWSISLKTRKELEP